MSAINHSAIRLAVRARALTLPAIATTGSASLGVSSNAYTRASGSFLTDGFEPGMELSASAFADSTNNGVATITEVAALTMKVDKALVDAAGAAGKTLAVGLPAVWEQEE